MTRFKLTVVILLPLSLWAATNKSPANCSSRPCTYTITCAAEDCTAPENAEVQTALNDAHRGDTIKLEARAIFNFDLVKISQRPGLSGYLTLTTTEDSSLPTREMTRITRHWDTKMPVIRGVRSLFLLCTPPVEHVRIRGLIFEGDGRGLNAIIIGCPACLLPGEPGYADQRGCVSGRRALADIEQPDDIIVEHCIFRNPNWNQDQHAYLLVNSRGSSIRNNWIAGARHAGVEVQLLNLINGPGPADVINNYLADCGGENIMHGGGGPNWDTAPSGSMLLNSFYNHPERMRGKNSAGAAWTASTVVFQGRWVKHPNGWFVAQNSGTTGTTIPNFPTSGSVMDNGISWLRQHASSSAGITIKNLYESKSSRDVINAWNQYRGMTTEAQAAAIVYKISAYPAANSIHGQCTEYMTGVANVNGTTVMSTPPQRLPNNHFPIQPSGYPDPRTIRLNGTNYQIADFVWNDDYKIILASSAGIQNNANFVYGDPAGGGCKPVYNLRNQFIHNIVQESVTALQQVQWSNAMQWRTGHFLVKGNLFRNISCEWGGSCGIGHAVNWFTAGVPNTVYDGNTVINSGTAQPDGGLLMSQTVSTRVFGRGFRRIRGNIWDKSNGKGIVGVEPGSSEGDPTTKQHLCNYADCTDDRWGFNAIAGVDKSLYTKGGTTWNLCPGNAACAVNFDNSSAVGGRLFQDWSRGILKVRDTHPGFHGNADGSSIGADFQMLPLIRNAAGTEGPSIETTANSALFTYWVHAPQVAYDLACSLEVSTSQDMDNLIPAADPNTLTDVHDSYPRRGAERRIVVTGLSASTKYWYRLHCGPITEGSFTTEGSAAAGSATVNFKATETTSFRIAFGTSYSRATDAIAGSSAGGWTPCTNGAACTVTAALPAGIVYWRVETQSGNKKPVNLTVQKTAASGPPPDPVPVCPSAPTAQVLLSKASIPIGQNSIVTAPAGWSMGTFTSADTARATVHPHHSMLAYVATGVTAGTVGISGSGWIAPNGATGCALPPKTLTVTALGNEVLVYDWNRGLQNAAQAQGRLVEGTTPSQPNNQPVRHNTNWTAAPNFAGGTYHVRVKIGCMTANDDFALAINHWCGNTGSCGELFTTPALNDLRFSFTGSAITRTFSIPLSDFTNLRNFTFATARTLVGWFAGENDNNFTSAVIPFDLRFTIVNVAPGGTFSGWPTWINTGQGERTYDCAHPHTVTITSPSNGATVSGDTPINVTAQDIVGVTKVDFRVDNQLLYVDAQSPYSYTWNAAGSGTRTITVRAWDLAGNTNSHEIQVTVP